MLIPSRLPALGVVLLLGLAFASCGHFSGTEVIDPDQVQDSSAGPDTSRSAAPLTSFHQDSSQAAGLLEQAWQFINRGPSDSLLIVSRQLESLSAKLLKEKFDSTLFFFYLSGMGGSGLALARMGKPDEGLPYMLKAVDSLIKGYNDPTHPRLSEAYNGVADIYGQKGDYEKTIEYLQKSLFIKKLRADELPPYYAANNLWNLANTFLAQNDLPRAILHFEQAGNEYTRVGVPDAVPQCLDALARTYARLGQIPKALATVEQAITLRKQLRHPAQQMALSYLTKGTIFARIPQNEKACNYLQKGIRMLEDNPDMWTNPYLWSGYLELGKALRLEKRYSESLSAFQNALKSSKKYLGTDLSRDIMIYGQIAGLLSDQGRITQSLDSIQVIFRHADPALTQRDFRENLPLSKFYSNYAFLDLLREKAELLYRLYEQSGELRDLQAAFSTGELAIRLIDQLRNGYSNAESKLELAENTIPVFEQQLRCALALYESTTDPDFLDTAFSILGKSKSGVLYDALQKRGAEGPRSPVQQREHQLKVDLAYYRKQLFDEQYQATPDSTKISFLHSKIFDLSRSLDSLQDDSFHDLTGYSLPNEVSLSRVRQQLPRQKTALIEYFMGGQTLYAFLVSPTKTSYLRLPVDSAFHRLIESVSNGLRLPPSLRSATGRPPDSFALASYRLYSLLLSPLLENTDFQHLILVPDGALSFLPFSVLLTEEPRIRSSGNRISLIQKYTLSYQYAAFLPGDVHRKTGSRKKYLGFAPSYAGDTPVAFRSGMDSIVVANTYPGWRTGFQDLQFNRSEVTEAASILDGDKYLDQYASEGAFKQHAVNCRILHLAMHAFTNDLEPTYSFLPFSATTDTAEDGRLYAYELFNMRLNADLAVLSACNTGAGRIQRGEGVMSLARAFRYAGCPNVVMSLWPANDASTQQLMIAFFRNLKKGMGKAEALRQAQLAFLHDPGNVEFAHPFYWAGFVLVGDDEAIDFGWSWGRYGLLALGICLFCGGLLYRIRKTRRSVGFAD